MKPTILFLLLALSVEAETRITNYVSAAPWFTNQPDQIVVKNALVQIWETRETNTDVIWPTHLEPGDGSINATPQMGGAIDLFYRVHPVPDANPTNKTIVTTIYAVTNVIYWMDKDNPWHMQKRVPIKTNEIQFQLQTNWMEITNK